MKKNILYISTVIAIFTATILISRPFRVSKVPNGSKFGCNTCHTAGGGTPRNPFGLEVQKRVTPNGTESFWGPELAHLDSDGDGFTNGQELGDPDGLWKEGQPNPGDPSKVTNPGDPNSVPTVSSVEEMQTPVTYKLLNNYPNPFNPTTNIAFEIPQSENVSLNIYNINGELIRTVVSEILPAGHFERTWDARDNNGKAVASGIYIYRLRAGNFSRSANMILLK